MPALLTATRLALPTLDDPAQLKGLVVNALDLFGEELGGYIDGFLSTSLGDEWLSHLARERRLTGFYSLQDPGFLLKEVLFYSTSPMRSALPKGERFYKRLKQIQNYRNLYFHNEGKRDTESVGVVINTLAQLAAEIPLPTCLSEFNAAIERLESLKAGETFDISQLHLEQIAALEKRLAELEDDYRSERELARKRQDEVDSAQRKLSLKEDELIKLRHSDDSKSAAYLKAEKDRTMAEQYVKSMTERYLQQLAIVEAKSQEEKRLQQLLKSATAAPIKQKAVKKKASGKTAKKVTTKTATQSKKATKKAVRKKAATKPKRDVPTIEPGSIWSGVKGTRRFTLSANFKTVYDTKTGELNESLKPIARRLAKEWLEIKPQGGRVFMDAKGNASCFVGEELIYLGNGAELLG